MNLRSIAERWSLDVDYNIQPFFQSSALNTSIIIKHRLRGNELDQFASPRRVATKILVPIQSNDLRVGARYLFVGQRGFKAALRNALGIVMQDDSVDLRTLAVLDESPTLDPFLLRELLLRRDLRPARCYFELSEADSKRMFRFAQGEIAPMIRMTGGTGDPSSPDATRLARKILSNSGDAELEPLRQTLQLDHQPFEDGVFSWKAFIYYKWKLAELLPQVQPVLTHIDTIRPRGGRLAQNRAYLAAARGNLRSGLAEAARRVHETLDVYESAYGALTTRGDSGAFRDFLLRAPGLFSQLGERLAAIEHMVSFWTFRFPPERLPVVTAEELADIFGDFETSLGAEPAKPAPPPPTAKVREPLEI